MTHLRTSCTNIRRNNQIATLTFTQLTPPRFQASQERLQKKGLELKRTKEISSFTFSVAMDHLVMKVAKRGYRPRTIFDDADQQENPPAQPMDVDEAGYRCPVCLGPYDNSNPIMLYHCGHNIHECCLRTALGQSTQCPICRQSPGISAQQINCTVCQDAIVDIEPSDDQVVVVARKCGHFHLGDASMTTLLD